MKKLTNILQKNCDMVTGGSHRRTATCECHEFFSSQFGTHFALTNYDAVKVHSIPASVHLCISVAAQ